MRTPTRENSYAQYCAWYTTLHQVLLPHLVILLHISFSDCYYYDYFYYSYENATASMYNN